VLRGEEPVADVVVELVETVGTEVRVQYAAVTNAAGTADFGAIADLAAPVTDPYRVRLSVCEHESEKESRMMTPTKQKPLYEREPRLKELEEKGLIRPPLREKTRLSRPLKLPGKPLSEYLDEVRGE
jgi:hypothetical protein